ncbi:MAG: YchE family NAAT transporter [Buchnera aphidicola (Periphyllus acericola)]|uniref:YchE family NAAT transporter n=1 Tax=Buchnera aphidicola TaxID=9 RepID=UPI0030CA9760|nr:YchE family NAAT transporter [Buchnera aphidicola (Periphyllus acericola)]
MNIFNFDYSIYVNFFISLFVLVNPIGMIPIFTSMTNNISYRERNRINRIANFSAFIILCVSLLIGQNILDFFKISISSFRISGGILIFMTSLSMIFDKKNVRNKKKKINLKNIAIIPLSMPLISGPGAISSTILWNNENPGFFNIIICILIMLIFFYFCYLIFEISPFFVQILGKVGIEITTKIMGLLLMSLSVEFVVSGIKSIF